MDNELVILAAVLAISEALALIPKLQSNSVLQLIINLLKRVVRR